MKNAYLSSDEIHRRNLLLDTYLNKMKYNSSTKPLKLRNTIASERKHSRDIKLVSTYMIVVRYQIPKAWLD